MLRHTTEETRVNIIKRTVINSASYLIRKKLSVDVQDKKSGNGEKVKDNKIRSGIYKQVKA